MSRFVSYACLSSKQTFIKIMNMRNTLKSASWIETANKRNKFFHAMEYMR